jgi:hypothetical protein
MSDRHNGRKVYTYLSVAGFRDIRIQSEMRDTSELEIDKRRLLFEESFAYRLKYFKQQFDLDPRNKEHAEDYHRMERLLKEFEMLFSVPSFWYGEYDYVGIARI